MLLCKVIYQEVKRMFLRIFHNIAKEKFGFELASTVVHPENDLG